MWPSTGLFRSLCSDIHEQIKGSNINQTAWNLHCDSDSIGNVQITQKSEKFIGIFELTQDLEAIKTACFSKHGKQWVTWTQRRPLVVWMYNLHHLLRTIIQGNHISNIKLNYLLIHQFCVIVYRLVKMPPYIDLL